MRTIDINADANRNVTTEGGHVVSFQAVQDIYNEITKKTESLNKTFQLNHKTTINDIIQLNHKFEQTIEQYNVSSKNCSVTVYHTNDSKQTFSSFDRFKIYDSSNLSPIENVHVEYNFLILLPTGEKARNYKVVIDITSRSALISKMRKDANFPIAFSRFATAWTGRFHIKYVDYAVARSIYTALDQWFNGLEQTEASKFVKPIQNFSHFLPVIFEIFLVSATSYAWWNFLQRISSEDGTINTLLDYYFFNIYFCIHSRSGWIYSWKVCRK